MAGRPLIFPKIAEKAPAILYCWWLGTEAGTAMVDVLWGKYNPSGRLPITFPKNLGQIPVYYNQKNSGRPATDQPEDYSGRYIDIDYKPQYPFAYGLSYTDFSYGNIVLSQNNSGVTLSMKITNTGNYDGTELVQAYIHKLWGEVTSPVKELKGFRQVFLKKGESCQIKIDIPYTDLQYYGVSGWCEAEDDYEIMLGRNATDLFWKEKIGIK